MNKDYKFGSLVKFFRNGYGYSQKHLATLSGLDKSTISRIESNESSPKLPQLDAIATAFEIELDVFISFWLKEKETLDLAYKNGTEPSLEYTRKMFKLFINSKTAGKEKKPESELIAVSSV